MRKKVRKSLAFLLALALVVSVMSGLGLSVSADDAQNEPVVTETEGEPAEEKLKAEESTPKEGEEEEEADPDAEAVPEEKKDEQKAEGEGSGDESPVKDTTADPNGEQKDEPQAEPAAEEQDAPVEEDSVPVVQAGEEVDTYTITCGDKQLTVKLYDENDNPIKGIAPKNLTIKKDTATSVDDYVAEVEGYTYSSAYYYYNYNSRYTAETEQIAYYDNRKYGWEIYNGWYSVNYRNLTEIADDTIYLVYKENADINDSFTVHYVDENGMEIGNKRQTVTVKGDKSIVFKNYATQIEGYTYWRACYSSANNAEVTKAVLESSGWQGTYYTFYNGSTKLTKPSQNGSFNGEEIRKLNDIYLVYVKQGKSPGSGGGTTGGGGSIQTPGHEKMAVRNDSDGTYDLSLSVSGSVGSSTQKAMVDIIYVLDMSNSMDTSDMAVTGDYGTQNIKRLTAANNAIKALTSSLTAEDSLIDARFALVTFSTHSSKKTFGDAKWTKDGTTLTNALPSKPSSGDEGGTNYEAGLKNAKTLLDDTRKNATTVVIFLSDGVPTFYDTASGIGGNGSDKDIADADGRAMSKARGIVKQMLPNYLFTVGVGNPKNYSNLGSVTDAAYSGVAIGNYVGDNNENLKKAFDDMKGKITSIACQNVTISDKLSKNVAMVMADDKPKKLVGKVTKNGVEVATLNADGTITLLETELNNGTTLPAPVYEDGTIKWVFPLGYKLEANYTYTVTANVDVTETAFENYRKGKGDSNPNEYPDKADAGTGTHAGKDGLFSNDNENAKLIYTVTGESEPKKVNYQKPVVQLTPSKLTIKKTVTGLDAEALAKLKNQLTFDVTYSYTKNNETKKVPVRFSEFKQEGDSNTYTYTSNELNCWSMDATYTVEEKGFMVEGYDCTNSGTTVTRKIVGRNQNETATFTNSYTPSNRTITLRKVVAGNMGDTNKKFEFSVSGGNATINKDTLTNDEEAIITAKVGEKVTITEDDYTSAGYTTTASATNDVTDGKYEDHSYTFTVTKDMSASTIITFTNDKTIRPPNGIITTIAPYAIMVVLAAGAGVYFVYSRRRRNR